MADSLALIWDLIARDNASATFRKVGAEAEGASGAVGKLLGGFTALAVGGAIAASVKAAADFQAKMLLVQTQAGATSDEVRKMSPAILSLAGQVAQAPEALATSLYHVESTGLRGKDALDAVRVAAEGAKVGHADLEETTNALTATIASGMLPATETYTQAMGQLNTIVGSGDMKMSDLNEALGTGLLVTMKQYGVTVPDVGAALADFGDNNIRGADAATKLRMAVQAIESPAKTGKAALEKIGITSSQLAQDMATGGLNKALTDLHDHLVNSGIDASQWGQLLTDAFTKKAGSGVLTLIGTFDRFKTKYDEVSKGADSFGNAWAATTKTANFQFAALGNSIEALGIKIGTAVLPYVTDLAKHVNEFVNSHGFQDFLATVGQGAVVAGNAIGGLVSGFTALPGPVKQLVGALAALKLAEMVGLWGALTGAANGLVGGISRAGGAMVSAAGAGGRLSEEMAVQQALFAAEWRDADLAAAGISRLDGAFMSSAAAAEVAAGGLTNVQRMMLGYDAALGETMAAQDLEVATMGRLTAAMTAMSIAGQRTLGALGSAATAGLGALQKTAGGIVNFLGGPWGVGLLAGAGVALAFKASLDQVNDAAGALTQSLKDGGPLPKALTDLQKNQSRSIADAHSLGDAWGIVKAAFADGASQITGSGDAASAAAAKGKKAYEDWYKSLSVVDERTQDVKLAQQALNDAMKANPASSSAVTNAARNLQEAQHLLAVETINANNATKTQAQLQQDATNALLGNVNATRAAQEASLQFGDALDQYNKDLAAGTRQGETAAQATRRLKEEQLGLVDSAIRSAQAAADAADAQDKQNGITDTAHDRQVALVKSLQASAEQMSGDGKKAVLDYIAQLGKQQSQAQLTSGAISALGVTVTSLPTEHLVQINVPTQQQEDDLHRLGYVTTHLPNGQVVVTADTHPALTEIQDLLNYARQQSIQFRAGLNVTNPLPGTSQRMGTYAAGGYTGDGGKYTPAGIVHAGEIVWSQDDIAAHGGVSAVESMRTFRGYAEGGIVIPASIDQASLAAMRSQLGGLAQQAGSYFGSPVGGNPAMRALGQRIAATMGFGGQFSAIDYIFSHESGWNPNAQNPTSTAYGIPQFLNSTWANYGGRTSDPAWQIIDGLMYMRDRYGSPNSAASFWQAHHWYKDGTNYVPSDQLAVLHKGEAVIPADKNQGAPYVGGSGPATFHLYDSSGALLGTMRGIAKAEADTAMGDLHDTMHYAGG